MLDWTIEVRDPSLARVGQFVDADLVDFLCVPRRNDVGSWSIKLPDTQIDETGKRVPHALCAALRAENAGLIVTGPQGVVISGPMIWAEQEQNPDEPEGTWTIIGVSDLVLSARHVAFPQPSNSNPATQTAANDVRTDKAERLLRSYFTANIGPSASSARRIADLTLAADLGRGPTLTKSPRFQNLLELQQQIATGSGVCFDLVQVGAGREFRVLTEKNVAALVRWDVDNRQLESAKYGYGAPDLTHAFVAGQGEGTDRKIIEVTTAESLAAAAVWGRHERFVDQRNTDDDGELTQKGQDELSEGAVVRSLQVVPSADMAAGFMVDWDLASIVTVTVGNQNLIVPVSEAPIHINREGVFIGAVVGDPTGFDWESVLAQKQRKLEQQVSALQRDTETPYSKSELDALIASGFRLRQTVYFTSSGTFTKATYPWLRAVRVRLVGGGGGGGGSSATGAAPNCSFGNGGGGGGYAEAFILASALAASETVTVGAGGTAGAIGSTGGTGGSSSFGSACAASGGIGGPNKPNSVYGSYLVGAAGGVGTAGDVLIGGNSGAAGQTAGAGLSSSGWGGNSQLGGGGGAQGAGGSPNVIVGTPGRNYGGGGGGALSNSSSSGTTGGAGAPGIVIVELYA